jgi:hypothetical protein
MRYFKTSNASRQYRAGDLAVTFVPVENVGGNWSGLLAVEDDEAAKKILAANHPQITEIKQEEYEGLKKKPPTPSTNFQDSPPPPAYSPQLRVAEGKAGSARTPSSKSPPPAPKVELKSAKLEVPDELKEVAPTPKPKPAAKPATKAPTKPPAKSPALKQKVATKLSPKSHKK